MTVAFPGRVTLPGLILVGLGLWTVMVAASVAIISGAPPQRAGMASSIESVSYELGGLAGVTVLGTILTAAYTNTIHLPATVPALAARQRLHLPLPQAAAHYLHRRRPAPRTAA